MAKRNKIRHDENTRQKIQASQLINRLQDHVLTHKKDPDFEKKEMTPSQVSAAMGLLKKILPDLQATELSQSSENPITPIISDRPMSKDEWTAQHCMDTPSGPTTRTD